MVGYSFSRCKCSIFSLNIPLTTDEYETLAASSFISNGQLPYRDFWQMHTPFSYYFFAPLFLVFKTMKIFYPARIIIYLLLLINGYFLFVLGKHLLSKETARFTLLAYLSSLPVLLKMIEIRPDVFVILFSNISLVLVVSKKLRHTWSFFLAGIFSAFAVLSKQSGIIPFFCVNAFFVIHALTGRWKAWRGGIFSKKRFNGNTYALFLSGFLLPLVIFIFYIVKHSAFDSFVQYAIFNDFFRATFLLKTESLHFSPYRFGRDILISNFILFVSVICLLLYLCFRWRAFKKSASGGILFLCIFFLGAFLSLFFILHPWPQDFLLLSQYLALLAAPGLSLFYRHIFARYWYHRKRFLGFILSFSLFGVIYFPPSFMHGYQIDESGQSKVFESCDFILSATNREDRCLSVVFPIPFRPSVYFYRLCGPEFESPIVLKHAEKSLLNEFVNNKIVVVMPLEVWGFDYGMPDLYRKLKDNYIQEQEQMFFVPGSVLRPHNGDDAVFNVMVQGYYRFREDWKGVRIDGMRLQRGIVYLTQGNHIISLPDPNKEYTIIYDLKSNKRNLD